MNGIINHHYLKTLPHYFRATERGDKPFEVRFNDRDFKRGDVLHLQEFVPPNTITGRELKRQITYILNDTKYCKTGYVVLGLKDYD